MVWLIEELRSAVDIFDGVAGVDPVSAVLLALGALVVGVASGVVGYLSLRGVLSAAVPDLSGRGPPQRD